MRWFKNQHKYSLNIYVSFLLIKKIETVTVNQTQHVLDNQQINERGELRKNIVVPLCNTTSVIKDPQATRNLNLIHYIDIVDFSNEKTCMILVEQHSPVVTTRIQNIVNKVWINQFIKNISSFNNASKFFKIV